MRLYFSSLLLPPVLALVISPTVLVSGAAQHDLQNEVLDNDVEQSSSHGPINSQNTPLHDAPDEKRSLNHAHREQDIQEHLVAMCEAGFVSSCQEAIELAESAANEKSQYKDEDIRITTSLLHHAADSYPSETEHSSRLLEGQNCDDWIQSYDPPYLSPNAISLICSKRSDAQEPDFKAIILKCFDHTFDDIEEIGGAIDWHCSSMPGIQATRSFWLRLVASLYLFFTLGVFVGVSWLYIRSIRHGGCYDQNGNTDTGIDPDDKEPLQDDSSFSSEYQKPPASVSLRGNTMRAK